MAEENCCFKKRTHLEFCAERGRDNCSLHGVKGPVRKKNILVLSHWHPTLTDEGCRWLSRVDSAQDDNNVRLLVPGLHITWAGYSQKVQTSLLLKQVSMFKVSYSKQSWRPWTTYKIIGVQEFTRGWVFRKEYLVSGNKFLPVLAQRFKIAVPISST
jgi:hypothetical protein